MSGRPYLRARSEIVRDLLETSCSLEDIAQKYCVSERALYNIAYAFDIDVRVRTKMRVALRRLAKIEDELRRLDALLVRPHQPEDLLTELDRVFAS